MPNIDSDHYATQLRQENTMTSPQPRCPALHPDLPCSRCTSEEGHAGEHVNTSGSLWDERERIGPKGEIDWHGLYLAENRRAEKAERDCVKYQADVADWKDAAERWQATAEEWEKRATAAENRPLTPEVTVGRVRGLREHLREWHDVHLGKGDAAEALRAALTEPPARPEGAERLESQIEAWDHEYGDDAIMTAPRLRELADFLAERGVRFATEERS